MSIRLKKIPTVPPKKNSEKETEKETPKLLEKLTHMQDKLFAQKKYSVLIILQGMDTSGKDSAVKHVFSGVNPAGCNVKSFKVPTEEEASHHFLWRISKKCPAKGMIQIFNRSHYEEILSPVVNKKIHKKRVKEYCEEINSFEKGLVKDNTILIKFFLHVSHKVQVERLKARIKDKHKRWKYQEEDILSIREHTRYLRAYETILHKCSSPEKWHIIPADIKWFKNYLILKHIVKRLEEYNIHYPDIKLSGKKHIDRL